MTQSEQMGVRTNAAGKGKARRGGTNQPKIHAKIPMPQVRQKRGQ